MKFTKKIIPVFIVLFAVVVAQFASPQSARAACAPAHIIYVSPTGDGSDGCSWATAFVHLQDALAIDSSGDQIWVAAGTYYPDLGTGQTNDARTSTFLVSQGVSVYGGFNGTETLLSQRNFVANETILHGDIGTLGIASDNAYHVVTIANISSTTRLDGFTIRGGNANEVENFGSGIYVATTSNALQLSNLIIRNNFGDNGSGLYAAGSSLTLTDVTFLNNTANIHGGGMYTQLGNPTLTRVTFTGNISKNFGGGLYNQDGSPTLVDVTFDSNQTQLTVSPGAGMYSAKTDAYAGTVAPVLTNVTFRNNQSLLGGAGGMFNFKSHAILTNVTFSGNSAYVRGGAMLNEGSNPVLNNVTFTGNTAPVGTGGAIRNITTNIATGSVVSSPIIKNTILWDNGTEEIVNDSGNSTTLTDSIVKGGCPALATCTNVIDANPVLGALASNGGNTQTITVGPGGSARDAGGVNEACAATDQRGVSRPQGSACDIGSFEAKLLTVTADPQTIPYGGSEPSYTFQYSGFFGGDTESAIDTPPTCGVSGAHTNAGTYPIVCSGGVDDEYIFAYVNNTLTINKATATLSVTNSPVDYNGSPQAATVVASAPGTVSNVLTGGTATKTNAGTYAVTANFVPTDTTNYNTLTNASAGDFVINKATPTLSVTNSPVTYNGTPRSASVSGSVAGTVSNVLTGGAASQTNAGTYAVTANFIPTDSTNYNSLVNASAGNFVINKFTATLSVTNSPVEFTGLPQAAVVVSSVPGSVSNVLTGGSATKTAVGIYPVTANFTPTDTTNYTTLVNASAGNFEIALDATPPDTTLLTWPIGPSVSNVQFTFSSPDVLAVFECKLDAGSYSPCSSPRSYNGLTNGTHTFTVRAKDPSNNVDPTPATLIWSVGFNLSTNKSSKVVSVSTITTQTGTTSGSVPALEYLQQSGTDDTPSTYVSFQTPTTAHKSTHSFHLPNSVSATSISSMLLQVNFKGPIAATQVWNWSVYDWNLNTWVAVGKMAGTNVNEWRTFTFEILNARRYVSPTGEIRMLLRSNNTNGDAKIDYEALHIVYITPSLPVAPVTSPSPPSIRPGIASPPR